MNGIGIFSLSSDAKLWKWMFLIGFLLCVAAHLLTRRGTYINTLKNGKEFLSDVWGIFPPLNVICGIPVFLLMVAAYLVFPVVSVLMMLVICKIKHRRYTVKYRGQLKDFDALYNFSDHVEIPEASDDDNPSGTVESDDPGGDPEPDGEKYENEMQR